MHYSNTGVGYTFNPLSSARLQPLTLISTYVTDASGHFLMLNIVTLTNRKCNSCVMPITGYTRQAYRKLTVAFSSFSGVSNNGWKRSSTVVNALSNAASFPLNSLGMSALSLDFDMFLRK